MTAEAVVVHDLRKSYGAAAALRSCSFAVQRGEIFGILGPNGAGKTTLLECIVGLRQPDGGTIAIDGMDGSRARQSVQRRIGVMLQANAFQDKITPREALELFGSFYGAAAEPERLLD